ncbi:hypothetical protein [Bradyrhizobium sp.]|uniref:hypothetical protein n=1 Tax=Bradyrhizobium sp. TaxID=376 RepID=UPI0039E2AEB2
MAVVTKYGTGYRDPTSLKAIDAISRGAELRVIKSRASIANGDNSGSLYYLGSLPSNAKINPGATLWCTAITGVSSAKLGFYYPNGGAKILDTALFSGQTLASATSVTMAAAANSGIATPANMDKFVWQLAGLSADPGGELDLVLTTAADASAAGDVWLELSYAKGV